MLKGIPPPPYQLSGIEFAQIGVVFDPVAVAPLLPPDVRLATPATGAFYCYTAPTGWGISPYNACIAFVDVEGFDSSDGSRGRAMLAAFYSGRAETALRQHLQLPVEVGGARLAREGSGAVSAIGLRGETAIIRLRLGVAKPPGEVRSGVHYYLARGPLDGVRIMPVAFCLPFGAARPLAVDILADDPELQRLRPVSLTWGGHHQNASITLGAPAQLPEEQSRLLQEEARVGVLSVLAELGRPAVLLDRQGRVAFVNRAAERTLGDGVRVSRGRLLSDSRSDQTALDALVTAAVKANVTERLEPIAIHRESGATSLIVRCFGMGRVSASPSSVGAVAIITRPERKGGVPSVTALKLLGLTSGEARVAALVGSGLSPRSAGERIGNTERTVRFTLGRVYEKLQISRQSELASIVAEFSEAPPLEMPMPFENEG